MRRLASAAIVGTLAGGFAVALVMARAPSGSDLPAAAPQLPPAEASVPGPIGVEPEPEPFETQQNLETGFEFSVPETWDVRESDGVTRLANPTGRIVVTLGPGSSGRLERASARLLDSLLDTQSDQELIGRTWDQIGGSRSLLVAGTAEEAGRSVRFLAITIRGQSHNYAITISVPQRSDPARVLPRLERIVSSLELLRSGPEIFAH